MNRTRKIVITVLLGLILALVTTVITVRLLATAPKTEPEEPERAARIVQVMDVKPGAERITVTAHGPVIPAREVTIRPQVTGLVQEIHPELQPGGFLTEGTALLRIDATDYDLLLEQRKADLVEARFELEVEEGRQDVAEQEWERLRQDLSNREYNEALVLREPHLRRSLAMVTKAESAISAAEIDLQRTRIEVPFNAVVLDEEVEVGQLVDSGSEVCRLVGTDEFWVRATLPVGELKWVSFPQGEKRGAEVDVHMDHGQGQGYHRTGEVVRLLTDLEDAGRMARILIRVEDPLGLQKEDAAPTPLLLGSYVQVDIEAGKLDDVLTIPRSALREGNRIWVATAEDTLDIREPEILWAQRDSVIIGNLLHPGESLVVSDLKSALPGLRVQPQRLDQDS